MLCSIPRLTSILYDSMVAVSPSDNEVDSVAIIDVLKNFIAEQEQKYSYNLKLLIF